MYVLVIPCQTGIPVGMIQVIHIGVNTPATFQKKQVKTAGGAIDTTSCSHEAVTGRRSEGKGRSGDNK